MSTPTVTPVKISQVDLLREFTTRMSTAFEEWEKAQKRRANLAYQIASAVAAGLTPRQDDINRFKATEAQMRALETRFTEET